MLCLLLICCALFSPKRQMVGVYKSQAQIQISEINEQEFKSTEYAQWHTQQFFPEGFN